MDKEEREVGWIRGKGEREKEEEEGKRRGRGRGKARPACLSWPTL